MCYICHQRNKLEGEGWMQEKQQRWEQAVRKLRVAHATEGELLGALPGQNS